MSELMRTEREPQSFRSVLLDDSDQQWLKAEAHRRQIPVSKLLRELIHDAKEREQNSGDHARTETVWI